MNKKRILIVSVVLAVIAVAMIQLYVNSVKEKYTGEENLKTIIVARQDIPTGAVVTK